MSKIIGVGLALFVLANLAVTLAYGLLWPHLYDWNIIDWDDEARFWFELMFHGGLAVFVGLPFCLWFARRISRISAVDSKR